ncbi:MAG: endonuclease/exonuclease/phosphatase family protein [Bdellovibrio sp.]|nr:endonuclease/exonuclease/phosphatase family protein [Bdellovibrio sp.]
MKLKSAVFLGLAFALRAYADDSSVLCQQDQVRQLSFSRQVISRVKPSNEVSLVTWNAHKLEDKNFFFDLKKLSESSDLLMVQEAVHTTAWQAAFASHMPFAFSFNKSFCWDDKANGVMTASRIGLNNNLALLSPGTEPGSFTHKVTGYSQILVGGKVVHVINTHALNFNVGIAFEEQIDHLVKFMAQLQGPIIWAGDFNTWNPLRTDYLNEKAKTLGLSHVNPARDSRFLVLDHIYVRGFTAISAEVLDLQSSDHFPIKATLRLNN